MEPPAKAFFFFLSVYTLSSTASLNKINRLQRKIPILPAKRIGVHKYTLYHRESFDTRSTRTVFKQIHTIIIHWINVIIILYVGIPTADNDLRVVSNMIIINDLYASCGKTSYIIQAIGMRARYTHFIIVVVAAASSAWSSCR